MFTFRKGTASDADMVIGFLNEIKSGMTNKEWLYLDPPDVVREMLSEGTMELWMALDEQRLAAVFTVLYPGLESFNYGYDLGFCREDLLRVIHMDTAAVHPSYRGFGLQRQMVAMAEQHLAGKGKRILLTTVHPGNRFSLNNMRNQGYVIQKRLDKYGSERFILRKNIF